jgi:hypothetical protein
LLEVAHSVVPLDLGSLGQEGEALFLANENAQLAFEEVRSTCSHDEPSP